MPIYTKNVDTSTEMLLIKKGSSWYTVPNVQNAKITDCKLWGNDADRSLTGEFKGTLIGLFPKLSLTVGYQTASERAELSTLLNQAATTVRAYNVSKQKFQIVPFYFNDVENTIGFWDKHGHFDSSGKYISDTLFDEISFNVIATKKST